MPLSARAEATTRRTYNRPLDDDGTKFETWSETVHRSHYAHHYKLWSEAGGKPDIDELIELNTLGESRAGLVSGRTMWLGGTPYAYSRAASQFNCSGIEITTVYDMVDAFWLLLNGCGVGGLPRAGTLHGYNQRVKKLTIVPSKNDKDLKGFQENRETQPDSDNGYVWKIVIGDSAFSWCKVLGKLLVSPRGRVDELVIDFSNVRGPGGRLKGYGWICNGYEPLANALAAIHEILNRCSGNLLTEEEICDIFNWCGTVLSSRRAAEILMLDAHHPHASEFSRRKFEYWKTPGQPRRQSNNSLLFWSRPKVAELCELLHANLVGGEPGFVNGEGAVRKAPWFRVFNPCAEILLPSSGFCNLTSICVSWFGKDYRALERAVYVMARANYRQTCVNLHDGILQPRWHQTNESLALCGVSLTGVTQAPWLTDYQIRRLRNAAITGAYSMADELGRPRPKAVTTIKPEGTRSKITNLPDGGEVCEGIHNPLGRHLFNWINFSVKDPLVEAHEKAGYKLLVNPSDSNNVLIRFPVGYNNLNCLTRVGGREVNLEPAVDQLRRYLRWNTIWADHNVSATISFDESEIMDLARLIYERWDDGYIATAFMRRADPTLSAAELGHPYLPQEVVTEESFRSALADVLPIDYDRFHHGVFEIGDASDCAGGVCPPK